MTIKNQWRIFKHWLNQCRLNKQEGAFVFVKSFLRNPKATGAVYPSSKRLAKVMASYVVFSQNQLIVELGAGTGVVTQALLNRGIAAERVIAIEFSPELAERLRMRFPKIKVIEGDASYLTELLKNETRPIGTIISGLPLRSLDKETIKRILSAIPLTLSTHGRYIQFTYDLRQKGHFYPQRYQLIQRKLVWLNIPPAKVEVYVILPHHK